MAVKQIIVRERILEWKMENTMLQEIPPVVRLQQQKTNEECKQCSYWGLLH